VEGGNNKGDLAGKRESRWGIVLGWVEEEAGLGGGLMVKVRGRRVAKLASPLRTLGILSV